MLKPRIFRLKDILPKHVRIIDRFSVWMPHSIYTKDDLASYKNIHRVPETLGDKAAFYAIQFVRKAYDTVTFYDQDKMTEAKWLVRCLFLETVAGVPGMVGGMGTHLKSIRDLTTDKGRIHHLIEQAENQRFHLHVFLELSKPGVIFRSLILGAQAVFFAFYMVSFLISRKFSHRFVGYLEEQACHTYTNMLRHIDTPTMSLHHYSIIKASEQARIYWSLPEDATLRDVIEVIRADEATHREVNHFFADIEENDLPEYEPLQIQEEAEKALFGKSLHDSKIPPYCKQMQIAEHAPGEYIVESVEKHEK